jgi:hypothetical protein
VNTDVLEEIVNEGRVEVHPSPLTIRIIQDKFVQKEHLRKHSVPIGPYLPVESTVEAIQNAGRKLGLPFMLKSRTLAYDGRGNYVVRDLAEAEQALAALGNRTLYAEKWVPFVKEVAVMAVRKKDGTVMSYPAVETVHKNNICHLVFAPLRSNRATVGLKASALAEQVVKTFEGAGVFGVEMFLLDDGKLIVPKEGTFTDVIQVPSMLMRSHRGPTIPDITPLKHVKHPNMPTTCALSSTFRYLLRRSRSRARPCSISLDTPHPCRISCLSSRLLSVPQVHTSICMVRRNAARVVRWGTLR